MNKSGCGNALNAQHPGLVPVKQQLDALQCCLALLRQGVSCLQLKDWVGVEEEANNIVEP